MEHRRAVWLLTISLVVDVGFTELGTSLLLVGSTDGTRLEGLMVGWKDTREGWLASCGVSSAVRDGDIIATKPLATTEDTPPVVLISDFRVRKVRRLGVLIGDGNIFAVKLLETTKVLPLTAPRVVGETIERLVSCTVSCDDEPGSPVVVTTEDGARVWVETVEL